jgi:anti-anti-sigma factor
MSLLQTSVTAGASGPLIVLSGVADISTITQLSGVITSQLSEITRQLMMMMIDVSGLRFADSAAIALLLLVARTLKGQGGSMVLIRPQPAVARAVTLADPDQIITIQGRTPRTPKSEGGRGSPGLGEKTTDQDQKRRSATECTEA